MTFMNKTKRRIGFLGTGYIADWHARAVSGLTGSTLAAVCDRNEAVARSFAARHKVPAVYTNLDAMLRAEQLDAVHVLLPPEHHAQAARQILTAGVSALLEKPMATSERDCADLVELAADRGLKLGVSHNFLFAPAYENLRADLHAGRLGTVDQATIIWNKPLGQLQSGPYDAWMIQSVENLVLEIAPHLVSAALDLFGPCRLTSVAADDDVVLPGGRRFPRLIRARAQARSTNIDMNMSFRSGFTEHTLHLRGRLGSATIDFERNCYVLRRHTPYELEFDHYAILRREARALGSQARSTLFRVVLGKVSRRGGNPYGLSIAGCVRAFHEATAGGLDRRVSGLLGRDVVGLCEELGRQAGRGYSPAPAVHPRGAGPRWPSGAQADVLLLGATGFIGRELAQQLVERGHRVRVLVRNPGRLPGDPWVHQVEVVQGDIGNPADLAAAVQGIRFVQHLARPLVKTWEEFLEHEVEATRKVALACLDAQVQRLIYTSTIDCYYAARRDVVITEQTPLDPAIGWRNYYAQSKALSEQVLGQLARERKLPVVIVRPAIVIGRGGSPLHWGIGKWPHDGVCQLWGQGTTPLPLVLVQDVAQGLILAMEVPGIEGESFNLAARPSLSARDYLRELEKAAGVEIFAYPTPIWKFAALDLLKWIVKRAVRHPDRRKPSLRDWESRAQRSTYDCTKARTVLGWKPVDDPAELARLGIAEPAREFLLDHPLTADTLAAPAGPSRREPAVSDGPLEHSIASAV